MSPYAALAARCPAAPCEVQLSDVAPFPWDRVAFVRMQTPLGPAAAALGVRELAQPEFEDWIVFVQGDQISKIDRRRYDPERPFDRTVFLDFAGSSARWQIFSRGQARFGVVRSTESGRENILLQPRPPQQAPPG